MEGKPLVRMNCEAMAIEFMLGYLHVFALCPPRLFPAYIVNFLKGNSAKKFPELKAAKSSGGRKDEENQYSRANS